MAAKAARKPARNVSPAKQAEREAKREALLTDLAEGISALVTSDAWQQYLDVQARFHNYSFTNTMLILCQRPTATQVASYRKWAELGRQVRKGESAIRVWAPCMRKVSEPSEAIITDGESETAERKVSGFVLVPVFDVSQTDGDPLPEPCKLLDGQDDNGIFASLSAYAQSLGYRVETPAEIPGHPTANGLCEYGNRCLSVASARSPLQMVKSLTHEIGHALLHEPKPDGTREESRSLCELEAESVAYVVCQSLGLDTSGYSFGYVATWQSGGAKKAAENIKASGKRISSASRKILDTLEAMKPADLGTHADLPYQAGDIFGYIAASAA